LSRQWVRLAGLIAASPGGSVVSGACFNHQKLSPLYEGSTMNYLRRKATGLLAAGTLAALSIVGLSPDAQAAVSCGSAGSGHCYALYGNGYWIGNTTDVMNGAGGDLEVACLAVHSITSQWANFEMWMATKYASNYWVEEGYKAGAGDGSHYGFQFFWSDARGSSYNDHFIRTATTGDVGVYTNITFNWVRGTTDWNVMLAGTRVGVSTSNGDSVGHGVEVGAEEAITNTAAVWGNVKNLQYDTGNGWAPLAHLGPIHTAGSNLSLSALGSTSGRPSFSVSTPSAPCGTTPKSIVLQGPPTRAQVERTAINEAQLQGDTVKVQKLDIVESTRAVAAAFDGGDVITTADVNEPVYVVEIAGKFHSEVRAPRGVQSKDGTVLRVSINKADGRITDTSLRASSNSSLSALGKMTTANVSG